MTAHIAAFVILLSVGLGRGASDSSTVTIHEFAFGLSEIHVTAGETVRWINEDPVPHTVTADDGAFDSGAIAPGESYEMRFDAPGTYPYHCTPHPFMTATAIVTAP